MARSKIYENGSWKIFGGGQIADLTPVATGSIKDTDNTAKGYWARVGSICVFSFYCNVNINAANQWITLGKSAQDMPGPAAVVPRFAAILDSGTGYTVRQIGIARLTADKKFEVAFGTAENTLRAVTVSGAYRCDNN